MTGRTVIRLPYERPPLTPNQRQHFAVKARLTKEIRSVASQCARAANIAPQPQSAVLTVWFPPDKRRRDAGSLVLTAKAAIDGLVDAGVWPDDDPTHVAEERYRIGPVDRDHPRIELHLIPATDCWVCDRSRPAPDACGSHCDADNELADRYAREGDHR